jgi:hypothetical protein
MVAFSLHENFSFYGILYSYDARAHFRSIILSIPRLSLSLRNPIALTLESNEPEHRLAHFVMFQTMECHNSILLVLF